MGLFKKNAHRFFFSFLFIYIYIFFKYESFKPLSEVAPGLLVIQIQFQVCCVFWNRFIQSYLVKSMNQICYMRLLFWWKKCCWILPIQTIKSDTYYWKMNETFSMQWIEESDIVKRHGNFQGQLLISFTS
jgi:hypothetical protein